MPHESWLQDFLVFFAAAGLVVPVFHRMRLGAVLGFLLVGVVVGPFGFGRLAADFPWLAYLTIEDRERVEPFAELGVMILLFLVGLELSLRRLWDMQRLVFGLGGSQVAITGALIGAAALTAGLGAESALLVGLALAMSSTAMVIQLLEEQGRSASETGRLALAVLLFQDIMVAPLLFLADVLGRNDGNILVSLGWALLQAALAVGIIVVLGRFVLRPMLRFTAQTGSRELIMAITVLIFVAVAVGTGLAGLSTALGAFLAGLLLSETEYRHHLQVDLSPFKGLLIGVFFVTVGMNLDLAAVWANLGAILAAVAGLMLLKSVVLFSIAKAFRCRFAPTAEAALLLAQAGEFAFIVLGLARGSELLSPEAAQFLAAVASLSLFVTPLLALAARRLGARLAHRDHAQHAPQAEAMERADHVIIGGYGRVGQMVAAMLRAENIDVVALDMNGELVSRHREADTEVFFGDASRAELLRRLGAERARAFVVTIDTPGAAERMIKAAREMRADAIVFARAKDVRHAARLSAAGARGVIPESIEASLQLAGSILEELGVPADAVDSRLEAARERERKRLEELTRAEEG